MNATPEKASSEPIEKKDAPEGTALESKDNKADVAKQDAEQVALEETKEELGDFVSVLTKKLEQELAQKYWADSPETDRIVGKVKDLAKIGTWLQVKWVINSVMWFFSFAQKLKPDLKVPEQLTQIQEKISPVADKIDAVEQQFTELTSWSVIEKAMMQAQWVDVNQLAWEQAADHQSIDTALTTLEQQAKQLREQKNITPMAYKMWYAKLLQGFIKNVSSSTLQQSSLSDTVTTINNQNNKIDSEHNDHDVEDHEMYDTTEESNIRIEEKEFVASMPFGFPISWMTEKDITSDFGPRSAPKKWASTDHKWIDIGLPVGTEIVAPADGKVISVKEQPTWAGKYIEIDHGNFITRYFHLNSQDVKEGDVVKKWHKVATLWNTGNSTGPHLHYEIRNKSEIVAENKNNAWRYKAIDPQDFWDFDWDGKVVAINKYKNKNTIDIDKSQVA